MIFRLRCYLTGSGLGPMLVKAITGSAGLRIAGMGFGFLVGVQLARGLGADGYGIYGVAMSIIALLTVPTEFGLPQLLTREIAVAKVERDWGKMKGIMRWSSRVSLLMSLLIGGGVAAWLLVAGEGFDSPLGTTLLAGVAMVPVVAQLSMRAAALRGLQQIVRGQVPDVLLRPMLYSLLLFFASLWFASLTPALAMALGLASAGSSLLLALYMLRKSLPKEVLAADATVDSRRWWSSALPMALTEGMRLLQAHLIILLLGAMMTMSEVGIYRVASSVVLLISMPISLFNIVSMPLIARLHANEERGRLKRLLGLVALGMTVGVVLLLLPFLIFGRDLLSLLFGQEFGESNIVLLVLGTGALMNALFGANAALLNMTGHQARVMRASLIALTLLAATAPPLIHFFGLIGAAVSSIISLSFWNAVMWRDGISLLSYDTSALSLTGQDKPYA